MQNNIVNAIGAVPAGLITYLFGVQDALLNALFFALAVDFVSGLAAARVNNELSSKVCFKGVTKKFFILCIAAMANILDDATGAGGMLRSVVLGFYIANEALSLIENGARLGVPMPPKFKEALIQLKGDTVKSE